jgi:hypothetical protein
VNLLIHVGTVYPVSKAVRPNDVFVFSSTTDYIDIFTTVPTVELDSVQLVQISPISLSGNYGIYNELVTGALF